MPGRRPAAGLLTSGAIFLYCSFLLLSALGSEPVSECVRDDGVGERWITVRAVRGSGGAVTDAGKPAGDGAHAC